MNKGIFHSKLLIVDYYGSLINIIDIQTENNLMSLQNEDDKTLINKTREFFIERIRQVEKENLDGVESLENANLDILDDLCSNLNKETLFRNFCFLVLNERYIRGVLLKVKLVITDWYVDEKKIEFIK